MFMLCPRAWVVDRRVWQFHPPKGDLFADPLPSLRRTGILSSVDKLPVTRLGPGCRDGLRHIGHMGVPVLSVVAVHTCPDQVGMHRTPASMLQKPVQRRTQSGETG